MSSEYHPSKHGAPGAPRQPQACRCQPAARALPRLAKLVRLVCMGGFSLLACMAPRTGAGAMPLPAQSGIDIYAADPLRSAATLASSAAGAFADASHPCAPAPLPVPLDIASAASQALCANPKTRAAWASAKAQAAQLGSARSAWLPDLAVNMTSARNHSRSEVPGAPIYGSDNRSHYVSQTLRLSWLVYDFGARSAALRQAFGMLEAAQAGHDAVLQQILLATARDYYGAVAAQAVVAACAEIEQAARDSLAAANALARGGAAPATDSLQAQTAYAQAVYNSAKARGELQLALGALALDMGQSPATPLTLVPPPQDEDAVAAERQSAQALLDAAQRSHPGVLAARAQLDAARARAELVRAQGRPTLTLNGNLGRNNRPVNPSVGSAGLPASGRDRYIGLELNIPLFDGFGRTYQVRQAEAQLESQQAQLDDAEQQVAQEVWRSHQGVLTSVENVRNSATLLDSARQSFGAAQYRYRNGAGNMVELLNAQGALAAAQQQRVQALRDWRTAKLQLAASLGRLNLPAL